MKNRDVSDEIKNINVLGNAMKTYTEYINNLIKEVVEENKRLKEENRNLKSQVNNYERVARNYHEKLMMKQGVILERNGGKLK
jgi:regulator of replication initiation timing